MHRPYDVGCQLANVDVPSSHTAGSLPNKTEPSEPFPHKLSAGAEVAVELEPDAVMAVPLPPHPADTVLVEGDVTADVTVSSPQVAPQDHQCPRNQIPFVPPLG